MDDSGFSGLNPGAFAVIYVPNETVQTISGLGEVINDVAIQVDKETDPEAIRTDVVSVLEDSLPEYSFSISTQAEHRVQRLLYEGADADQQFYHVIGLAILAGAVFAAFNLTSRIVQAQRREIGIGMALNVRHERLKCRVVVIVGDGECNEGSVWEAAMCASKHCLDNLTVIVDYNKMQSYSATSEVLTLEPFAQNGNLHGNSPAHLPGGRRVSCACGLFCDQGLITK